MLKKKIKPYTGTLSSAKLKKPEMIAVRKALDCYKSQRARCEKEDTYGFQYYGGKGIQVEYSRADFIGWYIEEFKKFEGHKPSIGRIDHEKNYSFDNIEMVTLRENCQERLRRKGNPRAGISISILDYKTKTLLMVCPSMRDAAMALKIKPQTVMKVLAGENKSAQKKNYYFEYAEGIT